jgi:DNA polymerase-1
MEEKKLFLLDAMALIYRAHFAFSKNPRINSKGMSTGAVLGFTNTLLDVLNKEKPTHIGVGFDTAEPTFRHQVFEDYKANREKQPEDIQIAIPYVKKIIKAFNIPSVEMDGFEADDIIGTLAKKAASMGYKVFMMTPDKDYAQLVDENIYLYKPAYMGNAVDILGIEEVLKKFEISRIDQVRDILGLQGDSVDNIPGVPGIGAKTAVKLINEFDSVENLIVNSDKLAGKLKENIQKFSEQAILSKKLATIDTNVPVEFNEEAFHYDGPEKDSLKTLFDELEFKTLSKRVFGEEKLTGTHVSGQISMFDKIDKEETDSQTAGPQKNINTENHDYKIVDTKKEIISLVSTMLKQKEFCFDTETTGIDPLIADIVGLSVSYRKSQAYYVPFPDDFNAAKELIGFFKPLFEHESQLKIGQNIKYDYLVLRRYGITVKGPFFDTMIAHYLIEPESRHNMDSLAEVYLNYTPVSIEELIGKKGKDQLTMREVEIKKVAEYSGEDADITLQLKHVFDPVLKRKKIDKLFNEVEVPLIGVLAAMEAEGVKIDNSALKVLSDEMAEDISRLEKEIYLLADETFNISSPKQLGDILFDKLRLIDNPKKTKTGQYATGEDVLIRLAADNEIIRKILDYREIQKLKSTYVDALPFMISPNDGRVHTSYNQAVAATGRLSSTNPNLQNIPIRTEKGKEVRKAFIARNEDYILLSADYSQIELRIMAHFSNDESMIRAFNENQDIHSITASRIFNVPVDAVDESMRRKAKTANFGIIYGISAFGLAERLSITRKESAEIIDSYFQKFPSVKSYMDEVINSAREKEYVETILGRRRYLRDINSRNATMRGFAERNAINAPIQGSAADLIKIAMINIHHFLERNSFKSKMILQVHDELVFDVFKPELEELRPEVVKLMREAIRLNVPVEVETGTGYNWLEAH